MDALTPKTIDLTPKTIDLTPLIPVLRALSLCIMGTLSMPYGHFSKYLKLKLKMMSYHASYLTFFPYGLCSTLYLSGSLKE